jgi:two-component system nitrate/nitrite response regulator NarP
MTLTARESEVAQLVSQGFRNKRVARELGLSKATVQSHLRAIYEKLDVSNRTELAVKMVLEQK